MIDLRKLADAMDQPWPRLCVHEAGHAVAFFLYGKVVFHVGLSSGEGGWVQPSPSAGATAEAVRQSMVATAAGSVAEAAFFGGDDYPEGKDRADLRQAAVRIHGLLADPSTLDTEINKAIETAREVVNKYKGEIEYVSSEIA